MLPTDDTSIYKPDTALALSPLAESSPSLLSVRVTGPTSTQPAESNEPQTSNYGPSCPWSTLSHEAAGSDFQLSSIGGVETGTGANINVACDDQCQSRSTSSTGQNTSQAESRSQNSTQKNPCTFGGCGKHFRRKYELQRHVTEQHGENGEFLCPHTSCKRSEAGKGFRRQTNLNEHIRRVHSTQPTTSTLIAKCCPKKAMRQVSEQDSGQQLLSGAYLDHQICHEHFQTD